ncbi:uncharacterized protein C2845_PM16G13800, partial [Panicum miliaceum]
LGRMNWIGRKIHVYNVTIGLYMLDWWERYLFKERRVSWGRAGAGPGPAMLEVVISIPAILLLIVLALGCYLLGRNRGRAEAAAAAPLQFAPPAPPPGLPPNAFARSPFHVDHYFHEPAHGILLTARSDLAWMIDLDDGGNRPATASIDGDMN